jgi:hypothetical protein
MSEGWLCPLCKSAHAPDVKTCPGGNFVAYPPIYIPMPYPPPCVPMPYLGPYLTFTAPSYTT